MLKNNSEHNNTALTDKEAQTKNFVYGRKSKNVVSESVNIDSGARGNSLLAVAKADEDKLDVLSASLEEENDYSVTLIPLMYESACPKGLKVIESSSDVFYLLHQLNDGLKIPIHLVNPTLIQLFTLNNVKVKLVTSAVGFVNFPFSTRDGSLITEISLESIAGKIAEQLTTEETFTEDKSPKADETESEASLNNRPWPKPVKNRAEVRASLLNDIAELDEQ